MEPPAKSNGHFTGTERNVPAPRPPGTDTVHWRDLGRLRALVEGLWDGIAVIGEDGSFLYAGPSTDRVLGYSGDELQGSDAFALIHPDDLARTRELFAQCLARPGASVTARYRCRHKDGSWRWVEGVGVNRLADPQVQGVAAWFRDVSVNMEAEAALRRSEERYRDLVENAIDVIYTHDGRGNFTSMNRAGEQVTGYRREEALRMNVSDIIAPEYLNMAMQMIEQKLRAGGTTTYEVEIVTRDGRRVPLEVSTRLVVEGGQGIGIQGIARDISGRKQLEEQFRHAQKLEAVGRLAGGIAHDFNNLLTAITGYSELLLARPEGETAARYPLEQIRKAAERAAALTRQLLAFSRKQVLAPKLLDLNRVILDLENMLQRLLGEDVELTLSLDPELGVVRADPGQLEQVLLNLAVNARDAMPQGGRLTLGTRNVSLDAAEARQRLDLHAGTYALLEVRDTGSGMTPEVLAHLFEPFFTTKEPGRGTGLGLSTAYGIIKQSNGHIEAVSTPGQGATFRIYLPHAEGQSVTAKMPDAPNRRRAGSETLLLVEDDRLVRGLLKTVLEHEGYTVLEAGHGAEALARLEKHAGPLHLLVTDVVMPRMNGRELAAAVARRHPEVKVLYVSGYAGSALFEHGVTDGATPFVQKPFTPEVLLAKVRDLLDDA